MEEEGAGRGGVRDWKGIPTLMWERVTQVGEGRGSGRLRETVMGSEKDGETGAERGCPQNGERRQREAEGG